ncbi:hypothetical protein ABIC83_002461 [Roseateles asaccharophilus]|uniref:hypothetical protein n=1 Tax=Roseateles asaccharophilus TaxID=582607 RepID=UPI0038338A0E
MSSLISHTGDVTPFIDRAALVWGAMPDETLHLLNSSKNLAEANSRIAQEMRAYYIPSEYGWIVVHPSVLAPACEDSFHYTGWQHLHGWYERIATGMEPQASIADRLVCAIEFLRFSTEQGNDIRADRSQAVQKMVSDILVQYPIFLHPKLLTGSPEYLDRVSGGCHTLLAAMLRSRRCELPSVRHGLAVEDVARFANSPLVKAPFVRAAPKKGSWVGAARTVNGSSTRKVEHNGAGMAEAARHGTPRAGMICSLLEIHRLQADANPISPMFFKHAEATAEGWIMQALGEAAGFWRRPYERAGQPIQHERFEALAPAVVDSGILAIEQNRVNLCRTLARDATAPGFGFNTEVPGSLVEENVARAVQALQEVKLAKDGAEAAGLLYNHLDDPRWTGILEINSDCAMGFMKGIVAAGYRLPEAPPGFESMKHRKDAENQAYAARWRSAHEVCMREQTMNLAIAAEAREPGRTEVAMPNRRARASI